MNIMTNKNNALCFELCLECFELLGEESDSWLSSNILWISWWINGSDSKGSALSFCSLTIGWWKYLSCGSSVVALLPEEQCVGGANPSHSTRVCRPTAESAVWGTVKYEFESHQTHQSHSDKSKFQSLSRTWRRGGTVMRVQYGYIAQRQRQHAQNLYSPRSNRGVSTKMPLSSSGRTKVFQALKWVSTTHRGASRIDGTGRLPVLRSRGRKTCEFESHIRHHYGRIDQLAESASSKAA